MSCELINNRSISNKWMKDLVTSLLPSRDKEKAWQKKTSKVERRQTRKANSTAASPKFKATIQVRYKAGYPTLLSIKVIARKP